MTGSPDGLSDTLRQMADNPGSGVIPDRPNAATDQAIVVGRIDDASGDGVGHARGANPTAARSPRRPSQRKRSGVTGVAAPVLGVVGLLLLIPAVWAALLLTGQAVWHHDRAGAHGMAGIMLVCWPVAMAILSVATYYHVRQRNGGGRR